MIRLKENVVTLLEKRHMEELKELLNNGDRVDVLDLVNLVDGLAQDQRAVVFRLLGKDLAIEVFEQLDTDLQYRLIMAFKEEKAMEIFSGMEPDDRARLLDELPARVAKRLVGSLEDGEREKTAILMGYAPRTAGRIMTPEYVRLRKGLSAHEALDAVKRNGKEKETVYTLYVTDDTRRLEGVLSLRDLVLSPPDRRVEEIMTGKVVRVTTDTDQEEVAKLLQAWDLLAVPVVDREDRLVGIITVDDAIDVLEEETTDDMFDKVGLTPLTRTETGRSQRLVSGSLWQVWRVRIPFLVVTLAGGMLAGAVIDAFEETLEAIAAVAIFIPVIMDMGGNAGTQSSTIFTRALVLGHIDIRRFGRHLAREAGVGLSIGVLMGTAAGWIAAIWQQGPQLGWAVGVALSLTVTLATGLGYLVPYTLVKMGMDQAAGSDPFITTIKDISGLFIYFFMVRLFLGL